MRSERKAEIKSVSFPQDRDRYRMEGSWHTIMGDKNKKDSELEAYHEKNNQFIITFYIDSLWLSESVYAPIR